MVDDVQGRTAPRSAQSAQKPLGPAMHHPQHRQGAHGDLDSETRREFIALFTDASANIRFAKAQQWHSLIYFSALCAGEVAVGVWLRWGDPSLVAFFFYLLWLFSMATIGTIAMLQNWQNSEARKQRFIAGYLTELTQHALDQKSRSAGDVHRYVMLAFMLLYVELATFAVSKMLWPHF